MSELRRLLDRILPAPQMESLTRVTYGQNEHSLYGIDPVLKANMDRTMNLLVENHRLEKKP